MREICVARYKENIEWLGPFKSISVIYNKGEHIDISGLKEIVTIPAIGYESYSYFSYIIDHYDKLPDVVAFIQGRIDDHLGDINNVHSKDDKKNPYIFLEYILQEAYDKGISAPLDERPITHHKWRLSTPTPNITCSVWPNMTEWWEGYVGLPWPGDTMRCCWCQCFAVRKDKILQHSKEFYIRMRDDPDAQCPNPEIAHFWERMFFSLFSINWNDYGK